MFVSLMQLHCSCFLVGNEGIYIYIYQDIYIYIVIYIYTPFKGLCRALTPSFSTKNQPVVTPCRQSSAFFQNMCDDPRLVLM